MASAIRRSCCPSASCTGPGKISARQQTRPSRTRCKTYQSNKGDKMKRYLLFLIVTAVILFAVANTAQAGKPRPTAYPPPDFEAQGYPAPLPPLAPTAVPSVLDQLYA